MEILLLTLLGFILIMLDLIFLPGGALVLVGSCSIIYGIFLNYKNHGWPAALVHFLACLATVPMLVRWSLDRVSLKKELLASDGFVGVDDHRAYFGLTGQARSDLRPSGTVMLLIEGEPIFLDCVAEGGYIEQGETVEIHEERGPSLIVRKVR